MNRSRCKIPWFSQNVRGRSGKATFEAKYLLTENFMQQVLHRKLVNQGPRCQSQDSGETWRMILIRRPSKIVDKNHRNPEGLLNNSSLRDYGIAGCHLNSHVKGRYSELNTQKSNQWVEQDDPAMSLS